MGLFEIGFVTVRLVDLLDIFLVSVLFYHVYQSLRGKMAVRIIGIVLGIFLAWKIVALLEFKLLKSILDEFLGLGAIALIIIFAPEIRSFLSKAGKNRLLDWLLGSKAQTADEDNIRELIESLKSIKATGNGALIVLVGTESLQEIEETGDALHSNLSSRLIYTIFQKESPLHDGAMIIEGSKIKAVRAILPISKRANLDPALGLRHRSAIGITEISDSLVIVASEERREISLAKDGTLHRAVNFSTIEDQIKRHYRVKQPSTSV